jgi:acyl-coenzyme A synthetase/AMP-(fatty) acid ligase
MSTRAHALLPSVEDESLLVMAGSIAATYARVRKQSEELLEKLKALAINRALVCSDSPVHLLRAIHACDRAGVELFIVHTAFSRSYLRSLVESRHIQMFIGEHDEYERREGAPSAGSYIHLMTSGTSGPPKIATHTLGSILNRIHVHDERTELRKARWLLAYQPTGFAGLQVILTAAATCGCVVVPADRSVRALYEASRDARVTHASGTPTFWRAFLNIFHPGEQRFCQITIGGERCDQALLDRLRAAFPDARISHTYASTEAGVVYAVHDGLEGFPSEWLENRSRDIQLRVRDGVLHVKTLGAMQQYASAPERPFSDDGWLRTSDRCEVIGNRAYIVGRCDREINVAGFKVNPGEIEAFLLTLRAIVEARVYGIPSPICGNVIAADVVLSNDRPVEALRTEILATCSASLARHAVPQILNVVPSIQTAPSGKKQQ